MITHCEISDFCRQNSRNTNYASNPIPRITSNTSSFSILSITDKTMTTASSFADESTSPANFTNNSSASISQAASKPKLGTYLIDRTIGKGIFSVVKLATHTITGINLAIKIIDKTRLDAENLTKIYRESEILKKLHHPNIVKLFQVMETPRLLYIAMEFLPNGEVFDYIANHGRFPEPEARIKFMDVLNAVDHIHSMGIVHRDIKAENLLFDAHMNIKLTDFSFGTHYSSTASQPLLTTWCGSPPYAAPEIFNGEPYVGTKADIWSLGVVLYVMVCGTLPFDAQPLPYLKNQVLSASFRIPYWLSLTCERLIRSMLSKCPAKRPSTQEVKQHPWLTSVPVAAEDCSPARPTSVHLVHHSLPHQLHPYSRPHPYSTSHRASSGDSPHIEQRSADVATGSLDGGIDRGLARSLDHGYPQHPPLAVGHALVNRPGISRSAPEGSAGSPNEFVLLIMESLGMKRSQILESLERRAYDHLMATYLLLGEKLRHHRYNLSFGVPIQSDVGSVHTICELGANKPRTSIAIGQCAKHSRVDSAVDVKCSSLESESPTSVMRLSAEPGVCDDAFRRNPAEDHNRHLRPSSPRQRTGPWTPNPDSGLISSLRTTAVAPVPNARIPSYSDSNNPITCFYPPHRPILPHSIATDSPVNNRETCLFSSIPHATEDRSPVCFTSPTDSSVFSANTAGNTFASLHSDLMRTSRPTVILDPQPGSSIPLQSAMVTGRVKVSDVQTNLPWFIHDEQPDSSLSPPVPRRSLARRKYVVFTPPDHLDQLVQAVMAEASIDRSQQPAELTNKETSRS